MREADDELQQTTLNIFFFFTSFKSQRASFSFSFFFHSSVCHCFLSFRKKNQKKKWGKEENNNKKKKKSRNCDEEDEIS